MLPTGRLKSRKSTLGTRNRLGIEPVRLLLPAASVKSKLGRSRRKNDVQKQSPLLHSASLQDGVHNFKKRLFSVDKENQQQSGTVHNASYEDISGIDEMVNLDEMVHKDSYCATEREASGEASSILTPRQNFVYNTNNFNFINRNEHKSIHSSVYTNSKICHDESQFLPFPSFFLPLNRVCSVSDETFLNKNHEINPQSKVMSQIIYDTVNSIPDIKLIQTDDEMKKCINVCEETRDSISHCDTDLKNHLIVNKKYTDKCTEDVNSNEKVTQTQFFELPSTCTGLQEVKNNENINDDSTLSFTFNELTCVTNESDIKCVDEQIHICNTVSFSKNQLPNAQKQTTESVEKQELLITETYCKCCMDTVNRVEAVITVIENTQTCIQSIEKNIIEQLRNSMKQLDIIKYDLTSSIQKNNMCSCECLRNKILNIPSNVNHTKSAMKISLLEDKSLAKNCNVSDSIGAKDSKSSLGCLNEFDERDAPQFKYKGTEESVDHINCNMLSDSVSCRNAPVSGNKTVLVKNVTFKIPHCTPISSRKKTKLYSNYKSHYNMCVKTPESSSKLKRQMNRSLVLTPHSMSDRLSTQIGTLFQN